MSNEADKQQKRHRWGRRVFWGVALGVLGFELIYVIAVNVMLRSHVLDNLVTGATKGLFLEIDSGWSVFPGRVHLEGLELHFEDYNVQFAVMIDEGTVDVAFWELPFKTLHLTRVRARGVRYHFRHRVHEAKGIEARLALYPKIPGYSDPPLYEGPPTPPLSDEQYDLWTIELEDVEAYARELWFLEYRFTGRARARGGFRLEPERDAQTELCTLALDGRLHVGDEAVASKLEGWLHARLDRHDPREVAGAQVFTKISVNTELDARIPSLAFSEIYREPDGIALSRGRGDLHVRAQVEHGAWMENTALDYRTGELRVAGKRLAVSGQIGLDAKVVRGGRDAHLTLTTRSSELALGVRGEPASDKAPTARELKAALGLVANLTEAIEPRSLTAKAQLAVPELRWLDHVFDRDGPFAAGSAHGELDLSWTKGERGSAALSLEAEQARFELADRVLQVSGTADAQVTYDGESRRGMFDTLRIELPQVAVANDDEWEPLPGGLRAQAEHFRFQGEPPTRMQGRFTLDAQSVEPFLPFVLSSSILRAITKVVASTGDTHAVVEVDRTPEALELRIERANSGALDAYGILRSERDTKEPCGRFFVQDPTLNVGIELHGGETSIDLFASPRWWRERPPTTSCGPDFHPEPAKKKARPPRPKATASLGGR